MQLVSVVVPVLNNAGSLRSLVGEIEASREATLQIGVDIEVVFVDDGSSDHSLDTMVSLRESVSQMSISVVKLTRNFGAIAASKRGLESARGDAFVILAADMQDPPSLLAEMIPYWLKGERLVICERVERSDTFTSQLFSRAYYSLVRSLIIPDYPRGGFDVALFDRQLLPYVLDGGKTMMTPLLLFWLGFKPVVLQYRRRRRLVGKSAWTFRKRVGLFFNVLFGYSPMPLRLASILGSLTAVGSFLYGSSVFVAALRADIPVEGFATLAVLVSFLSGLTLLMLGVIGEYIWRITVHLNGRPESVVDSIWVDEC